MKCVLLLRCETWLLCLLQYIIPTLSENAQQRQFLLNWVCYKSSVSGGFLMPIILLNLYLITTLLGCCKIKNLLSFLLLVCEISDNIAKCRKSSGLFYDFFLSKSLIYKVWMHKFFAVGWGQWNHTHSLDRPSFSFSRQLHVGYKKYALSDEKHVPSEWRQCQVNQELSTQQTSLLCVLKTHYLWVLEVKPLHNEIQLSRN